MYTVLYSGANACNVDPMLVKIDPVLVKRSQGLYSEVEPLHALRSQSSKVEPVLAK